MQGHNDERRRDSHTDDDPSTPGRPANDSERCSAVSRKSSGSVPPASAPTPTQLARESGDLAELGFIMPIGATFRGACNLC